MRVQLFEAKHGKDKWFWGFHKDETLMQIGGNFKTKKEAIKFGKINFER